MENQAFTENYQVSKNAIKKAIGWALLIKLVIFIFLTFLFNRGTGDKETVGYIFTYTKDWKSYLEPSVNFVDHGTCYELQKGKQLFAHKMPGMVPIFSPLYYLFGFNTSLVILVILQFLVDVLCCVLLGKICLHYFKTRLAFWLGTIIYAVNPIISVSVHYGVSELFCTSFLIIALFFFTHAKNRKHYFLAGLFITWSLFIRPTGGIMYLVLTLPLLKMIVSRNYVTIRSRTIVHLLVFVSPFVIAETGWITRNYMLMRRVVPTELSWENHGTIGMKALFRLVQKIGGDYQTWNPDAEMNWFVEPSSEGYKTEHANSFRFPSYFLDVVSPTDLVLLRNDYYKYMDPKTDGAIKQMLEYRIVHAVDEMIGKFRSERPLKYYVLAPLRSLSIFLFIKRPYGFNFPVNGIAEKVFRFLHFGIYYVILLTFILSNVFAIRTRKNFLTAPNAYAIIHILLIGFILHFTENRYLVPALPFMLIFCIPELEGGYKFLNLKKVVKG